MSLYVLDTDTFTLLQMAHPLVCQRSATHSPAELALTVITVDEELSGWHAQPRRARQRDQLARAYQRFADGVRNLSGWPILSFTEPAILRFEQLVALKLNVGNNDLRIAAITLENGGILVTRNLRDFQRVPNLTVENWAV